MNALKLFIAILFLSLSMAGNAQDEKDKKGKEIKILEVKTSAQCEMCKERIEKNMAFEKVLKKFVELKLWKLKL
ncbi:MAG: hypothetical protein R2764_16265 [Bacteroidales bacterium]